MKYYIPCEWTQTGFHIIEAESLEAAVDLALNSNDQGLEATPPAWQEMGNSEYDVDPDEVRMATAEEVAQSENAHRSVPMKLLAKVEAFISGFEDDETQPNVRGLLAEIRVVRGEV